MKKIYWIIIIVLAIGAAVSGYFWYRFARQETAGTTTATNDIAGVTSQIKIFLIAPSDAGKSGVQIGCGDSIVGVQKEIAPTKAPLSAAIKELLKIKDQNYGQSGLVDTLYESNLTLDSAAITDGKAIVKLSGNLVINGVCNAPQIKAQLEQTALQFASIKSVEFFINGQKLDDILSQK